MKAKSIFATLLFLSLTVIGFSQISMEYHNQLKVNICDHEQDVLVVDSITLYETDISYNLFNLNTNNADFELEVLGFSSQNDDTVYLALTFNHNTTALGAVDVDIYAETGANLAPGGNGVVKSLFSYTFNFILHGNPTSFSSASVGSICSSDAPLTISNYVTPPGGYFEGPGITNTTIFDPSATQGSMDSVRYIYEDVSTGCIDTAYWDFHNNLSSDPVFSSVVANDASSCSGADGSIDITPGGGASSFEASTVTGDTISIVIGSSGSFTGLNPGSYFITLTDDNGCKATTSTTVSSSDLNISGTVNNPSCQGGNNGSIDVTINASSSYTFYWEHGNVNNEDLSGLSSGQYTINAFDDNGCQVSKTFTVTDPNNFYFNSSNMYSYGYTCSDLIGGAIYTSVEGNGPFTYSFLPAGGNIVDDSTYLDLDPGNYTVEVTDASGCTIDTVINIQASSIWDNYAILHSSTPSSCTGADGALDIDVEINYPLVFDTMYWSHGVATEDLTGLAPGTYTFVIENSDNPLCDASFDFVVDAEAPAYNDICLITVDSLSSTNVVVWEKAQTTGIDHYNIYRETNTLGQYIKVGEVPYADESYFNDLYASPLVQSWKYKISAVNDCGVEGDLSTAHRTIHLRRYNIGNDVYELNWNQYEGFGYGDHDLWRFTAITGWELIATVPFNQTSYVDQPPSISYLDYAIEVDPGYTCTSEKATSHNASRSNRSQGIFNPGNGLGTGTMPVVSIPENDVATFTIYPNPAQSQVRLLLDQAGYYNVEIYSMNGQLLYENNTAVNERLLVVNTRAFANGVYLIKVFSDQGINTQKLIINK